MDGGGWVMDELMGLMDEWLNRQIDGCIDGFMAGWIETYQMVWLISKWRWMDVWGYMDKWLDRWVDEWIDRLVYG